MLASLDDARSDLELLQYASFWARDAAPYLCEASCLTVAHQPGEQRDHARLTRARCRKLGGLLR